MSDYCTGLHKYLKLGLRPPMLSNLYSLAEQEQVLPGLEEKLDSGAQPLISEVTQALSSDLVEQLERSLARTGAPAYGPSPAGNSEDP